MKIELIRGDSLKLKFTRKDDEGKAILTTPSALYFSVKNNTYQNDVILQKVLDDMEFDSVSGQYSFFINPEDTDKLDYGSYKFDLEVKDEIGGLEYTKTIAIGDFIIKEEVTFVSNEV